MNPTTNDSKKLLALNKPKGYLVTRSDDLGRKTVYNLLPDWAFEDAWMPIGRLDLESKGLLLFTTNGKINDALTKTLSRKLKTGFGYYIAMEKSKYSGFHIHLMLTFSQGSKYSFTILNEARDCLYALDCVSTAIALPRKTERSVSIDTADYYTAFKEIKKTNNYFHDLKDTADFKDAVYRYSYLSKEETKLEEELKGIRLTQSKIPKADKTKQEQKKRTIKKIG